MSESNGNAANGHGAVLAPAAKAKDEYLGPLCAICHVPILCHPIPDEKSGCASHVPALGPIHRSRELSEARVAAVARDQAEVERAGEDYRRGVAGKAPGSPAVTSTPPGTTDPAPGQTEATPDSRRRGDGPSVGTPTVFLPTFWIVPPDRDNSLDGWRRGEAANIGVRRGPGGTLAEKGGANHG